jgi:hypothetical protein
MSKTKAVTGFVSVLLVWCCYARPAQAAEVTGKNLDPAAGSPVVSWTFDEDRETGAVQPAGERLDSLQGAIELAPGVCGSGLKFDGFTSRLARAAKDLPGFGPALTVEAWIAPQEYSWAWTGIVDHDQDGRAGFFLGINHLGQVGFHAAVDGQWLGCDSQEPVELLRWTHVAGTFDPASGFTLYVNGQRVGAKVAKGNFKPAEGLDLLIGMAHRKQCPALTEREPSKKFLSNITYGFNHVDPDTGWGEWTDEYYFIYPDAVAVRYQEIRSTWAAKMEWQQTELINQPGTRPQDNVEVEAMMIANMDGETETWSWEKPYGNLAPGNQPIKDGNIQVMNLKSKQRHFVIGEAGAHWKPLRFGALEGYSTMPCWNHWPVAQLPNDGRVTPAPDRPSSTCLGTLFPVKHKTDRPDLMLGRNLYGLTGKPAKELAVLARSWNFPAELKVSASAFESLGYDKNQRAYVLARKSAADNAPLELTLAGRSQSPVLNPAFIVKKWGGTDVTLTLDGKPIPRGTGFRFGHRQTLEGTDLIVWIETESRASLTFHLQSQPQP